MALVQLLLHTRIEEVLFSESSAGRGLRLYFDERFLGVFPQNRLCRAVLVIPQCHAEYLRGRRRQALRTNLRRAAAAGIQCEWVTESPTVIEAGREIFSCQRVPLTEAEIDSTMNSWSQMFARPDITLGVARDGRGRPLALMAAAIDQSVCLIHAAVASTHEARWALHDHLVQLLIDREVNYLLCEGNGPFGALGFPAEIHHYQRLLGYELRHLVPLSARRIAAASLDRRMDAFAGYPAGSRGR